METIDLTFVNEAVERIGKGSEKVLELLQAIQGHYGYLPQEALEKVCELTQITPATISGVTTFYDQYRHQPAGKHIIHVCVGTACHVKGSDMVYDAFLRYLKIPEGEDTDSQRLFTVEKIACLGCCTLAPAVQIGQVTYGHLTSETVPSVISDYLKYEETRASQKSCSGGVEAHTAKKDFAGEIRLGLGSCCVARGSGKLREALDQALKETGVKLAIKRVGCVGMCFQTPLLEIVMPDNSTFLYARVQP
jgi:NADH:ubiquinone oxidoreductase subunit E